MQSNSIDFLDEINTKYAALECELEQKLKKILLDEQKFDKMYATKRVTFTDGTSKPKTCKTTESARLRNNKLIKDLEVSKARLRSRATYSPLEQELNKAIANYEQNKSLAPINAGTMKKTYGPTFV